MAIETPGEFKFFSGIVKIWLDAGQDCSVARKAGVIMPETLGSVCA
jgi:hypothetical protein